MYHGPARIPDAVISMKDAVLCLNASSKGELLHFSGFVVDRRGLVLSTAHDLEGITVLTITDDAGKEYPGEIVQRDTVLDLTLIRVKQGFVNAITLPTVKRRLEAGETIYMVHCSAGNHYSVKSGVVARQQAVVGDNLLWQVKMAVSPGNSGSPAFDREGRLIGMAKGRYRGTENRGFLIPLDTIAEFLGREKR